VYCSNCGAHNPDDAKFCSKCGFQLGTRAVVVTSQDLSAYYAGFWKRFLALLIDSVILLIGGSIVGGIFGIVIGAFLEGAPIGTRKAIAGAIGYILGIFLNWLYFTLLESSSVQATIGKMALGIIVTDLNGNRISFARANARYWSRYISIFFLFWSKYISILILFVDYIMICFTKKKQALHDIIAGTLVINKSKRSIREKKLTEQSPVTSPPRKFST
jgi:uncharacterized RDD family membrane protein YckC